MHYDVIVLGGGSAGLTVSAGAAALGRRTLLIEKERMGGDCTWFGCVPSKALLHAAKVVRAIRTAPELGLPEAAEYPQRIPYGPVLDHVHAIQQGIYEHETPEAWAKLGVEVRLGDASFSDPRTLQLDGEALTADRFVIATGSRSVAPPIPGLEEAGYWDHKDVFTRRDMPPSLVVLGGGPIGCEMSQALRRLGVEVALLQRGAHLLAREDRDAAEVVQEQLREEGVAVHLQADASCVRVANGKKWVKFATPDGEVEVSAADILVATGRKPNVEGLGLDRAGVRTGNRGIEVDAQLRSVTNPNVYACGDVAGRYLFTHTAEYEARHVVTGLALQRPLLQFLQPFFASPKYRPVPWTTFTEPELARVGMSETEARRSGRRIQVYKHPFSKVDRAITEGKTRGFVKVVTTPWRGKILGVTIVGPNAGELLHEWVLAMHRGVPLRKMASMIHTYPTLARSARKTADLYLREFLLGQLQRFRRSASKAETEGT